MIHNAGALHATRQTTADGIEETVAVQVVAPFLLNSLLLERLGEQPPGRVLTMSSGGMYTAPLTVGGLELDADAYRGTDQYARAKRAQVTLNEMWAEFVDPHDVVFHAAHPGWADTPGVRSALPRFRRLMGPWLRDADQGADTIAWLAADDATPVVVQRRLLARPEAPGHPSARPHAAQRHRRTAAGAVVVVRRAQRRRSRPPSLSQTVIRRGPPPRTHRVDRIPSRLLMNPATRQSTPPHNVAVVGSGISGLTAAYVLTRAGRRVTLFEADSRLGGHTHSHDVDDGSGPTLTIDTGFIVYNERTYPLLTRLFAELAVETRPCLMGMSVSCDGCGLEYAGRRGLGRSVPAPRQRPGRLPADARRNHPLSACCPEAAHDVRHRGRRRIGR